MSKANTAKEPRLLARYKSEVIPAMMKKFNYRNVMQVPKIEKISLNMGVGEGSQDAKFIEGAVEDLTIISGQKVVVTKSKKAISNFKIRAGVPVGCRTTLRQAKMYEFMDRLVNIAIPRIRDFKGVSDSGFDGRGNYTLGIREQIIFPEINYDKVVKVRGLNITFVTTAKTDEETYELLKLFGMPFQKR
ncbi:50S ribosomal protein L5 [bacterium]|nr:50S ribosomal protein L5 [bacterium]